MELEKVLHVKGGSEETSYAHMSYIAGRAIAMTKTIREQAIARLFSQEDHEPPLVNTTLCAADLGCASGPNTLTVVSELIIASQKIRQRLNEQSDLEYQVYLNDLPGNDFNSVFMSVPRFNQQLKEQTEVKTGQCFVAGVPGSFYGRLFPRQSLHFMHSSYSLYWLSQVPEGLKGNKLNIHISSKSPSNVVEAYKEQFQKDTALFLRSRSEELVKGGQMVLTYWGRATEDPASKESSHGWDLLSNVLNQLVSEGIIEEEKVEAFNIPLYHPSSTEVLEEVKREGSFYVNAVDVSQVDTDGQEKGNNIMNKESNNVSRKGERPSSSLRSMVESLFASHFGAAVIDEIFQRYSRVIADVYSKQKVVLPTITISLTKK